MYEVRKAMYIRIYESIVIEFFLLDIIVLKYTEYVQIFQYLK